MWNEMSQYMPNTAVMSETAARPDGNAAQAGRPDMRSERRPQRSSSGTRPDRWPKPSTSRAVVTTIAPAVAMTIWLISAPPAGLEAARSVWNMTLLRVPSNEVTSNPAIFDALMPERRLRAVDTPEHGELTIEQLAQETGMTVRNIRNHQSRGLLPPPEVRARTGYYGSEHVERLRLIRALQADGFNLEAIRRLLAEGVADSFVGLKRAATAPFETEPAEIINGEELYERFGETHPKVFDKAVKLGLIVPLADGRIEVPSPALLRAAEEVMER